MKTFLRSLTATLALALTLGLAAPAFAGEAQDLVQARRAEVAQLMKSPPSADRDKKVAGILTGLFDYDAMAQGSMGKHWDDLSDDQKSEFANLLKQLIQRNIEKNVKSTLDYNVDFLGEEASGDGVLVKTKASSKTNPREEPLEIDYQMHKVSDVWRSTDVITEGSSLVGNYRHQFDRIMKKDGYASLIKKMKEKLARDTAANAK